MKPDDERVAAEVKNFPKICSDADMSKMNEVQADVYADHIARLRLANSRIKSILLGGLLVVMSVILVGALDAEPESLGKLSNWMLILSTSFTVIGFCMMKYFVSQSTSLLVECGFDPEYAKEINRKRN